MCFVCVCVLIMIHRTGLCWERKKERGKGYGERERELFQVGKRCHFQGEKQI